MISSTVLERSFVVRLHYVGDRVHAVKLTKYAPWNPTARGANYPRP